MKEFEFLQLLTVSLLLFAIIQGQQTTGSLQTCTYSFLVPNDASGPQSTCSGNSQQMKQLEDQISALQQQVQNLQKAPGSTKGRVIQVEKPSFNCQCGVNSTVDFVFRDCEDVAEFMEAAVPGTYKVEPVKDIGRLISVQDANGNKDKFWLAQTSDPFDVYCDFDDMNTAWMVLMRRRYFNVDFNRTWQEYKNGFGNIGNGGDFWLGLEKMHLITSQSSPGFTLWIVMRDDKSIPRISAYSQFSVGPESEGYELKLSGFHGENEDYMGGNRDPYKYYGYIGETPYSRQFETKDRKSESSVNDVNCAKMNRTSYRLGGGGWWFMKTSSRSSYENFGCGRANLNAKKPQWGDRNVKFVEMRIRPNL